MPNCYVYKSGRKPDTYVYLRDRDRFDVLPATLRERLGALQLVLELELTAQRRMARENPVVVLESLARQGFHLQLPPQTDFNPPRPL